MRPRFEDIIPEIIFSKLHGCELKVYYTARMCKTKQKEKGLICQFNLVVATAGSQISSLFLFS